MSKILSTATVLVKFKIKGVIIGGSFQFDSYDFVWEHAYAIRLSHLGEVEWQQSYFPNLSNPSDEDVNPLH